MGAIVFNFAAARNNRKSRSATENGFPGDSHLSRASGKKAAFLSLRKNAR
jgi:hypothetical protein